MIVNNMFLVNIKCANAPIYNGHLESNDPYKQFFCN